MSKTFNARVKAFQLTPSFFRVAGGGFGLKGQRYRGDEPLVAAILMGFALLLGANWVQAQVASQIQEPAPKAATPQEWARSFAEATQSTDVPKLVALGGDQITVFYADKPQRTGQGASHGKELNEFYGKFNAAGKAIAAADYSISQLSNDFAIVRYTWVVSEAETGVVSFRVNSTYLIRLQSNGWRFTAVIELGQPKGPQSPP